MRDVNQAVEKELGAALLDDVVVVEIGERIAVGACGTLLAHLGATVIALEPAHATFRGKWRNRAATMAGKLSVVTRNAADNAALVESLVDAADIVLLSSDDGTSIDAWQREFAATTIVADITAFGHGGPYEGQGGSEELVQALTGIVATTGPADKPPVAIGVPVLEMTSAVYAAASVLLALRVRRLHGRGQRIDIALADSAVNSLANFLALHFGGLRPERSGNRHPLYVPWGSYHARDGYLLACSVTDEQFQRICRAIRAPDLAIDQRYATTTGRLKHFVELDRRINAWAAAHSVDECEAAMVAAGVASGRIVRVEDLAREPNLVHRGSVLCLRDEGRGAPVTVPTSPIRGDAIRIVNPTRIPARGEGGGAVAELLRTRTVTCATQCASTLPGAAPLAGVRIVEIGHYTVAPLASRIMGAFGADVIKVEAPQGDAVRYGPPLRDDGQAYIFALSNTDKRGLVLNLREDADRDQLHRLLAQADILIENMRPGALARLGLGGAALRERHPRLIYCSITGFGSDSVYEGRAALDSVIQAMSGMMSLTLVDGEPTKTGVSTSDNLGGLIGMLASIAGLELRDRTGVASHFDISMQDCSAWMTQHTLADAPSPATSPRIVKANDGFVLVLGLGDPANDALVDGSGSRQDVAAAFRAAGCESAPVLEVGEVLEHPHTVARELLVRRPTSDGSNWTVLSSPMRLQMTPPCVRSVMSRLGAENSAVISEFGLTTVLPAEI